MTAHTRESAHIKGRPATECAALRPARLLRSVGATLALLILVAAAGRAEPLDPIPVEFTTHSSHLEFGLLYQSEDSYRYGDFTGLEEEGIHAVGNVDIWGRRRFDSDSARYWHFQGSNLGLDSRSVHLDYGEQGSYGFSFDFDQIPRFETDSALTFMGGEGGTYLSLPAGWVGANTPPTMPSLAASLAPLEVDYERMRIGGGAYFVPSDNWKLTTRFDRDIRDGTQITGGLIGISGGNPRSVLIPQTLDYTTDTLDLNLEYALDRIQMQMGYHLSAFDNGNRSMTWENPYTYAGVWDPAAEWPNGLGRKGLAPDNRFDQLTFSGGYTLGSTRFVLNAALGRMKQDQSFLPYTVNALTVTTPLPRGDLDGEINTTFVNFRVNARPTSRLTLNASYLYDDRDNETPQDTYIYVPSDATSQGVISDSTARINHAYSSKKNEIELEAGYRLARHTDLSLGYTMEHMERSHQEVDTTLENGFEARLRMRPVDRLTTGIKLGYAVRKADTYHFAEPFLSGHSPDYIATQSGVGLWENHPLLRRFYLADRKREEVGLFGTYMPTDNLSMNLNVSYDNDDYDDSELGLTGTKQTRYMLDLSWVPREDLNTYAFYSLEYLQYDVNGWNFRGGASKAVDYVDPTRRWSETTKDRIHTLGLGAKMRLIPDRLDLSLDYLYARSDERNNVRVGSSLGDGSFPHATTRLHNARVGLDYKLRENVTVRVGYLFEKFQANDWAYDLLTPASLSQVVVTGQEVPTYTNHLVTWSLVYKFW